MHSSHSSHHNERLEFLGDSLVNFYVAEALYRRFSNSREGDLTRLRALLVKGATLAELARELHIGEYLRMGQGERASGGAQRDSILADATEALIGAIYLDGGDEICRNLVLQWYGERLDKLDVSSPPKDPKTELQEWLQGQHWPLPKYEISGQSGPAHKQQFEVACWLQKPGLKAVGSGSSRRSAEQDAAANALQQLQQESR